MGYCKLCRQHGESAFDCDCRCYDYYLVSDDIDDCYAYNCPGHHDEDVADDVPPTLDEFILGCVTDCIEGPSPGAANWEYQAGELPIKLSWSIKVF